MIVLLKKIYDLLLPDHTPRTQEEKIVSLFPVNRLLNCFGEGGSNPECLFFGDSVVERISRYDSDTRTMDQMVSGIIGESSSLCCFSHSAYHMGIFYMLIRAIQTLKKKPSTIILPINMRSLSPQWDLYPPFQCTDQIEIIKNYIYMKGEKINYPLYGIDKKGDENNFYQTKIKYPCINFTRIKELTDIAWHKKKHENNKSFRLKILFIFHYLYPLGINHRKLILMKDLMELLLDMGIKPLIYITPINYKAGIKYVGEEFTLHYKKNIDVVHRVLKNFKGSILFNDYSMIFDPDFFFHEDDTTEHLNENGRLKLAYLVFNEYRKLTNQHQH